LHIDVVQSHPEEEQEGEEEEQRACLEARRGGLELPGLQGHEGPWALERGLLQQELRLFRHNTVIFYMKLRWILMHWRLDRRMEPADDASQQPEVSPPHRPEVYTTEMFGFYNTL